jgi:hypothetical protein
LNSPVATGLIGVFGVVVGVFIERLVQRYGKLRFIDSELGIWIRGSDETGEWSVPEAVYGLPADPEQLERAEWLEFRVEVQFFNEKEVRTGLRDVAVNFSGPGGIRIESNLSRVTRSGSPDRLSRDRIDHINLPSREWVSLELEGSFHDSTQGEQILAFAQCNSAYLRGYFPDGREFRRRLRVRDKPPI